MVKSNQDEQCQQLKKELYNLRIQLAYQVKSLSDEDIKIIKSEIKEKQKEIRRYLLFKEMTENMEGEKVK